MCQVVKPFVYNEHFTVIKGEEYWNSGSLLFPPGVQREDKFHRSMFGPGPSMSDSTYGVCNENFSLATRRLTSCISPEIPGFHWYLRFCQKSFIRRHKDFLIHLCSLFSLSFHKFTTISQECIDHHDDPHNKRDARIVAFSELLESGKLYEANSTFIIRTPNWKMKPQEKAKFDKYPRTIVDMTTPASLAGFRLCEFYKQAAFANPIHINDGLMEYCKSPNSTDLRRAFNLLYNPPGKYYFLYYSDDSCIAIRSKGKVLWYNLDISSCDSSHTEAMFSALLETCPIAVRPYMADLVAQCCAPIQFASCANSKHKVKIKPKTPTLYSGVTLTGAINGLACMLIMLSLSENDFVDGSSIRDAAERVGYIVTGWEKPLEVFEDVQFLKHSPVRDLAGNWQPMLNLGVLIRASGQCKYDLPGRGCQIKRARDFQFGLVQGAYPFRRCTVIDNMRAACGDATPDQRAIDTFDLYKVDVAAEDTMIRLDDQSVYRRYRLNGVEQHDLEQVYSKMTTGQWYNGPSVSKILALDYGLTTIERETPEWLSGAYRDIVSL